MLLVFLELMLLCLFEMIPAIKSNIQGQLGRSWPDFLLIYSGYILASSLLFHVDFHYIRIYMVLPIVTTLYEYYLAYHHRLDISRSIVKLSQLLVITFLLALLFQKLFALSLVISLFWLLPLAMIVNQRKWLLTWLFHKQ